MTTSINAVAFKDDGVWIAQCIEHDIVASAPSIDGLRHALEKSIAANLSVARELGGNGLDGISPAPRRFHDLFARAGERLEPIRRGAKDAAVVVAAIRLIELEPLGGR